MLEKLLVSKNTNGENKRLGKFLLTGFFGIFSVLSVGMIYSLFSSNPVLGAGELNVSALIAAPPPDAKPFEKKQAPAAQATEATSGKPLRQANIRRIEENPAKIPETISVTPSKFETRPTEPFDIGSDDLGSGQISSNGFSAARENTGSSLPDASNFPENPSQANITQKKPEIPAPPVLKKEPAPEKKKEQKTVSGGVVNGKALYLAQPVYAAAARTLNVSGKVTVQVLIDEDGNVVSAKAVEGHPLLRHSAVEAARESRFTPTLLSKQKVRVSGVILYNFIK